MHIIFLFTLKICIKMRIYTKLQIIYNFYVNLQKNCDQKLVLFIFHLKFTSNYNSSFCILMS